VGHTTVFSHWGTRGCILLSHLSDACALGDIDDLANLEVRRDLAGVGSLNLTDGDASLGSKGTESVTRDDGVLVVGARAARADRDDGCVASEDGIKALEPVLVGFLEDVELKVEVVGDEGERILREDNVYRGVDGKTPSAVLGASWLDKVLKAAGLVGCFCAVGWDDEEITDINEVRVGNVVVLGNVACTRLELVGNGGQGITSDNSVVASIPGATGHLSIRTVAFNALVKSGYEE
jgi:hypothetical protein